MAANQFNVSPTIGAVDPEALNINRKKMLAQMLLNQSQAPQQGQMVSGHYIPPSTLGTVVNAIAPIAALKMASEADTAESQLSQKRMQMVADILNGKSAPTQNDAQNQTGQPPSTDINNQQPQQLASSSAIDPRASQLIQLGMMGYPGAMDAAKMLQDANRPIPLREGDLVNPRTGQSIFQSAKMPEGMLPVRDEKGQIVGYRTLPGFGTAKAGMEYPGEYAKASLEPTTVNAAAGPYMTNKAVASGAPNPFVTQPQIPGQTIPQQNTPSQANGIPLMGPKQEKQQTALGEYGGSLQKEIDDSASLAMQNKARIVEMNKLLDTGQVSSGPLAKQAMFTGNLMKELGIPWKDPSNSQEFQKYATQGATEVARKLFGGRISTAEVNLMINAMPGSNLTEKANRAILKFMDMANDRDIQKQTVFQQYKNKGGQLEDFNTYFNANYPLQGVSSKSVDQPAQNQTLPGNGKGYSHLWGG